MKKNIAMLSLALLALAALAFAAGEAKPDLRPSQIVMQARAAWMASMGKNIEAQDFAAVARDATALAAETRKGGANHPNPLGKELTLAIAALAKDVSDAAAAKNGDAAKAALGKIKEKCNECHAKLRK